MKKINKKVLAGVGLGAMALVGGTFAYYNQTVSLENPLSTGKYDNELIEEFTPPTEDLKPGATIDKVVGAKNTGDYPVMVRIRMDESWKRSVDGKIEDIISHRSELGDAFEVNMTNSTSEYITKQQRNDTDGETAGDGSVVRKNMADLSDWTFNQEDGYWYYNKILNKGESTSDLLKSITLATNMDLGLYETKDYYFFGNSEPVDETQWKEYTVTRDESSMVTGIEIGGELVADTNDDGFVDAIDMAKKLGISGGNKLYRKNESLLNPDHKGYADANYTLTVTSQFVQATPDALTEAFGSVMPDNIKDIITGISADMGMEKPQN